MRETPLTRVITMIVGAIQELPERCHLNNIDNWQMRGLVYTKVCTKVYKI